MASTKKKTAINSVTERIYKRGITRASSGRGLPPRSWRFRNRYPETEIYIQYEMLPIETLGYILNALNEIKVQEISKFQSILGIQLHTQPVITIASMHTGKSITFTIGGTVVTIPIKKRYELAAFVISILLAAFTSYNTYVKNSVEVEQMRLQNQDKMIDIESKRIDLEKKKEDWQKHKDSAAGQLVLFFKQDKNITSVRLNGKKVK